MVVSVYRGVLFGNNRRLGFRREYEIKGRIGNGNYFDGGFEGFFIWLEGLFLCFI